MDQTDIAILGILRQNSRCQWKEIGEKVHLTGQAVSARVQALQDAGVIRRFTVALDETKLGKSLLAFITVFMSSNDHTAFRAFIRRQSAITEAHRVSGEGCYWLKAALASHDELTALLESILRYGNYRVNISIATITDESE